MVGVADRLRRPRRAAIDAVAASWTIGSEEDGPALYLAGVRRAALISVSCDAWPGVRPGRASQGRARSADAGPATPRAAPPWSSKAQFGRSQSLPVRMDGCVAPCARPSARPSGWPRAQTGSISLPSRCTRVV